MENHFFSIIFAKFVDVNTFFSWTRYSTKHFPETLAQRNTRKRLKNCRHRIICRPTVRGQPHEVVAFEFEASQYSKSTFVHNHWLTNILSLLFYRCCTDRPHLALGPHNRESSSARRAQLSVLLSSSTKCSLFHRHR